MKFITTIPTFQFERNRVEHTWDQAVEAVVHPWHLWVNNTPMCYGTVSQADDGATSTQIRTSKVVPSVTAATMVSPTS